jgi:RNA polymerase sigma factor FliA
MKDLKQYALRTLSRTERLVMILYYSEGLTMREVGVALGLSESRVSQIRGIILAKLRDRVRNSRRDSAP